MKNGITSAVQQRISYTNMGSSFNVMCLGVYCLSERERKHCVKLSLMHQWNNDHWQK